MSRTVEDYRQALLALLPTGQIWPQGAESTLGELAGGLAGELLRTDLKVGELVTEADPRTTEDMLSDWEEACGLPDHCLGRPVYDQTRRAALVEHLTTLRKMTPAYYVALAATQGWDIEIREFAALRVGFRAGDRSMGIAWAHAFRVLVSGAVAPVTYFRAGYRAGQPLSSWGDASLECYITSRKPAHDVVLFRYLRALATDSGAFLDLGGRALAV